MPGPPPKRSDERRRRNKPAGGEVTKLDLDTIGDGADPNSLAFLIAQPIVIPEPVTGYVEQDFDGEEDQPDTGAWHPIARELWDSFMRSGQAVYWEPSDWMVAKLLCESISRDLKPQVVGIMQPSEMGPGQVVRERIPLKGASLGAYLKAFSQLMLTEGERRRISVELERERTKADLEAGAKAGVVQIKDRRQARLIIAQKQAESS